jgi:hypothetical protein
MTPMAKKTYYRRILPSTILVPAITPLGVKFLPVQDWAWAFLFLVAAIIVNSCWATGLFDSKPSEHA